MARNINRAAINGGRGSQFTELETRKAAKGTLELRWWEMTQDPTLSTHLQWSGAVEGCAQCTAGHCNLQSERLEQNQRLETQKKKRMRRLEEN